MIMLFLNRFKFFHLVYPRYEVLNSATGIDKPGINHDVRGNGITGTCPLDSLQMHSIHNSFASFNLDDAEILPFVDDISMAFFQLGLVLLRQRDKQIPSDLIRQEENLELLEAIADETFTEDSWRMFVAETELFLLKVEMSVVQFVGQEVSKRNAAGVELDQPHFWLCARQLSHSERIEANLHAGLQEESHLAVRHASNVNIRNIPVDALSLKKCIRISFGIIVDLFLEADYPKLVVDE